MHQTPFQGIVEWLWSFLPDQCEIEGCCRNGVRGHENIVYIEGRPRLVCDFCHTKLAAGLSATEANS